MSAPHGPPHGTSPGTPRILVCDDEPDLRGMVAEYLRERGFEAEEAGDAGSLRAALAESAFDLVVLDVRMPGEDGLSALRRLREENGVPVIMLTAVAGTIDRVVGLEMGADDYVAKPVDLRELEARVKAVLRRRAAPDSPAPARPRPGMVQMGRCTLDLDGASLLGPEGEDVPITAMEFAMLRVFAENRGRVLSRDRLLELAHDREWDPFDRSIDIRVSRLRRKIEPNPKHPETIRTVRGIGYVFG